MDATTTNLIIWLSPLIVGAVIALLNSTGVNNVTESIESWARRSQQNVSYKSGWFNSWVLHPILWIIVQFSNWTDSFKHQGLKNGVRVSSSLYLLVAWGYLIFLAFMVIVGILLFILVLYITAAIIKGYDKN